MSTQANLHSRPYGVGLSYRFPLQEVILQNRDYIDLLEIPTEDYIIRKRRVEADPDERLLSEITQQIPSVVHGISLSIGSVEPLDRVYLNETKRLMERHNFEVFSEHLAFHRMDGNDLTAFLAMPFEEEAVQWVKANYEAIREVLGRPFSLENVTYYFAAPKNRLTEADFLRRITEETDATLLLDVTNVYNNSQNHGYDAMEFLDRVPLDKVAQIHLAGGELRDGKWEDCHNSPVMEGVWGLFEEVIKRTKTEIVILERDSKFLPFETVMEDVHKAREIFYKYRPAKPDWENPHRHFPAAKWNDVELPAYESDRYRNVRGFQRSVMKRITSEEFRREFREAPGKALEGFGLDEDWKERVQLCDPPSMDHLARLWRGVCKENAEWEEESQKREWEAWSKILEQEEARGASAGGASR